jgi:hypothetical protein
MKDALDIRSAFERNHDLPAGAALHPATRHRSAPSVAVPSPVHDPEPEQEDRQPLSEFAVLMVLLAYLAVIVTLGYLLWTKFTSDYNP